jgi:hypothetical protein
MSGFIPRDLERHPLRAQHGVPMRALPKDFRRKAFYAEVRKLASKEPMATTAIVDRQSVKSAEKGGLGSMLPATMRARKSEARSVTSLSTRLA